MTKMSLKQFEERLVQRCPQAHEEMIRSFVASRELHNLSAPPDRNRDSQLEWPSQNLFTEGVTLYPSELSVFDRVVARFLLSLPGSKPGKNRQLLVTNREAMKNHE